MSYTFSADPKSGYVYCKVTGDNSSENVARYLEDVYNACVEHQCPYVLMEDDLKGPGLAVTDIFRLVSQGSQKTWPHVKRIAYIDTNPEHSEANMRFAETVARNRGVLVQFFKNIEEAEHWLNLRGKKSAG